MSQTGVQVSFAMSTIQWSLCFETKCHNALSFWNNAEINMKLMFSTSKFIAYEHVDSEKYLRWV